MSPRLVLSHSPRLNRSVSRASRFSLAAMVALALIAIPPAARGACPGFLTSVPYGTGSAPESVAAGDFNRDGWTDLAVANEDSNTVSILRAVGDGTFLAAVPYETGFSPRSVAAGDFDGNGILDLVTANFEDGGVSILLGNAGGGFESPVPQFAHTGPVHVAVADFDRDGMLDLAVTNSTGGRVSIRLGNGSGGFDLPTHLFPFSSPRSTAIGDFDRNGTLDLVVANHDSDSVAFLAGNGSGGFGAAAPFSIPATSPALTSAPVSVAAGDFDADGMLDIAVANEDSGTVAILLGNGAGSFGAATTISVGVTPRAVVAGDFSGDGDLDLAVASHGSNRVSILEGNGSGGFASPLHLATGAGPAGLAIGDFNGDGATDLASANSGDDNVSVLLNGAACFANCGAFGAAAGFGGGPAGSSVAYGDFDRDGILDLAVAEASFDQVSVLLGSGAGGFGAPSSHNVGDLPSWVTVADLNRDGSLDLAVANHDSDDVSILLGDGNGGFGSATSFDAGTSRSGPRAIAVGDFDGDGMADLAVSCALSREISILRNTASPGAGTPSFSATTITNVGDALGQGPRGLAAGDLDRDGNLDLAIADFGDGASSSSVLIRLGDGTGGFTPGTGMSVQRGPVAVGIGDFNRDGRLDLAVANSGSDTVSIGLGNQTAGFDSATPLSVGSDPSAIALGHYDSDGSLDLAVANGGGNDLSILLGDGAGGFETPVPTAYDAGPTPASVAAADFDGDGKTDFAVANDDFFSNVSILLNSCPPPDLTVTKVHFTQFMQGGTNSYSITVTNIAAVPTGGLVTVTDTLPAGLTATSLSGGGWNCVLASLTCTRSDALEGNGSYPPIGLNVSVASNAPASVDNIATVGGGSETNTTNNTATDTTSITQFPDLTLTKTHTGNFTQGQSGALYTITVMNIGGASSSGLVTMTDTLPDGLSATAMSGSGWSCTLAPLRCTRSNPLASGLSYPAITLTVNVASDAPALVNNVAAVSGGGGSNNANNSATDPTTIIQVPDLTVTKTHTGDFTQGQTGRTYSITVRNSGGAATSGTVTLTDTLPPKLTATGMAGSGWSCTLGTRTCTRSDALAPSSNYPAITLIVSVASDAPPLVTNTATVSGGGQTNTTNDVASNPTTVKSGTPHCGSFAPAVSVDNVNSAPTSVAIGDLDGDGAPDLAAANFSSDNVSIMLGQGDGTFPSVDFYGAGDGPTSVVMGDFNDDDHLDLAVSNLSSGNVSILLGNGDGTFETAENYEAGSSPKSVAVGDFDGDGNLDLAVAGSVLAILLGEGDGTFAVAINYFAGSAPDSVAVGDFDGDGAQDLAVANSIDRLVAVLLGNGDGTFAAKDDYVAGLGPKSVVVGDFNGDARQDLAVANESSDDLVVLLGNGDGSFAAPVAYSAGLFPRSVALGDFNGDGKEDLVVAGGANNVSVFFGNGSGTFETAENYQAGSGPEWVAVGDVNGDERPDLAVANFTSRDVSILLSACADLAISKSHAGDFAQGQTGATYTVTVANQGLIATSGIITVTDALPAGLTATAIAGSGWSCSLATLTCTRSSVLAPSASYPPITVTVQVHSNAAASVTNSASVSGSGDGNAANDTASDPTTVDAAALIAPTRLVATASSTSQVGLTWDAVTSAVSYRVHRSSNNGPFTLIASPAGTTFPDSGLSGDTTYLYRVFAVNGASAVGPSSNIDLATTIVFANDPVVGGTSPILALHLQQLRTAVDAVRAAAGLGNATYSNAVTSGSLIRAADLTQLRANLDAARDDIGVPPLTYLDPALGPGTTAKAAHVQDIRNGTK